MFLEERQKLARVRNKTSVQYQNCTCPPLDSFTAMYATNPNYELQEGKLQTQPTFQGVQCCIHLRKNHKVFPPKRVNDMFNYNDRYLPKVFQRVTCDSNKFYFATVL